MGKKKGRPVARTALFGISRRSDDYMFDIAELVSTVLVSIIVPLSIGAAVSTLVTIVSTVVTFSAGTISVVFVTLVVSLLVHAEARRAAPTMATVERTARM
jgi:hypothetical protein